MALLAEQLVDEWLYRNGFFTLRGIKSGVHEIDLLGVRMSKRRLKVGTPNARSASGRSVTSAGFPKTVSLNSEQKVPRQQKVDLNILSRQT